MLKAGSDLFEYDEKGFFDEGSDEWILRKEGFELEYEEGEPALTSKQNTKPELNLGLCDCGAEWDHEGICKKEENHSQEPVKKKRNGRNSKRRGF